MRPLVVFLCGRGGEPHMTTDKLFVEVHGLTPDDLDPGDDTELANHIHSFIQEDLGHDVDGVATVVNELLETAEWSETDLSQTEDGYVKLEFVLPRRPEVRK